MAPTAFLYLLNASGEARQEAILSHDIERLTSGNEDEGGAGVDNTSSGGQDRRAVVGDGLVNTPVLRGGGSRCQGAVHGGQPNRENDQDPGPTRS